MGLFRRRDPRAEMDAASRRLEQIRAEFYRNWLAEQYEIDEFCRAEGVERGERPCYHCYGNGHTDESCHWCHGTGDDDDYESCWRCLGRGRIEENCSWCNGSGAVS